MKIRPLRPDDWAAVWPMLLDMQFVDSEEGARARFPEFCLRPDWALLGAEQNGRLLGYAAAHDYGPHLRSGNDQRTAKLHDLYTLESERRRGVGRALMQEIEAWGRARDLRFIEWYANEKVAVAYERMGYRSAPSGQEGYLYFDIDLRPG